MVDAAGQWALIAGLGLLSVGCTMLLRWAAQSTEEVRHGSMAWPLLGGLLAGVLLGPSILGRIIPQEYEKWFTGAVAQRQALSELVGRQGADLLVAEHARLPPEEIRSLREHHLAELAKAHGEWQQVHRDHQRPIRRAAIAIGVLTLLGCGVLAMRSHSLRASQIDRAYSSFELAFLFVLIPWLTALVAVKIDVFEDVRLWPLLLVPLLSGLAGFLRATWLSSAKARAPLAGAALASITAIAAYTGAIPNALVLPLLAGAIFLELVATLRTPIRP